jgi:hypothetical protein
MSDYFFYDLNKKMADLANKQQLAETAQATPVKPAPNKLMEAAADYSAKKAAAGKDIGKPGKNFSKIAAGAAKRYGSAEAGKRVAGAVLNKLRHTEESIDQAQLRPYKATMKEGGKPDFLDLDKDGNRKEPMKSAARGAKKDVAEGDLNELSTGLLKRYKKSAQLDVDTTDNAGIYNDTDVDRMGRRTTGITRATSKIKSNNKKEQGVDESALQAAFGKKKYGDQGMKALQKAGRDHAGDSTMNKIRNRYDKYDESMMDEVDATPQHVDEPVSKPVRKASAPVYAPGDMDGATAPPAKGPDGRYPIVTSGPNKGKRWSPATPGPTNPAMKEGGIPMTPKQQKFAKLAPPMDKITFADKIVGAKKEVDEMLGDVAATAMKNAVGKMRGRNRDMEEGFMDDEPTSRRSSTGGRIDTSEPGVTRHRAVKGNYSGAGHDAGADDEPSGAVGRRKVGAGMGKKIGAKINRGTSKLMTKEGDMPKDMIEPQDSGEYDQEGDMAKDTIKTVVRHAQALEKILGDDDNLPEWVQSKLAKIENMMTAVDDYMQNQNDDDMPMEEERTNKRDNRAEKAGRKVAKDIEYDEKKKDGIHGKRRDSEDSKAERAGKKVTKDIEYDEKKDKKKKEVDETTSSGSVATSAAAPKSGGGTSYGKGIYDSLNRQLENMISEGMNINMSMNNDEHGGPRKSLTVTATDDDAVMLAGLLKMAGMGSGDEHMHDMTDNDSQMLAIQTMGDEDTCSACGSSPCGCDDQMMDEAYGDTDATENKPDYPTDEEGTDNAMMYSGGLNGPKSTGQTTIPVIAGQDDRMGYNGDNELRRMMEIAGLR